MSLNVCTIIAQNYLPQARVLARSFAKHHPRGTFTALLLDGTADAHAEHFAIRSLGEIGLDPGELHDMAMLYDITELATAVKPWFLRSLLTSDHDHVAYFDPDIEFFAPMDDIVEMARDSGIVLTPHVTSPIPRDGRLPSEQGILLSGIFNLGFIAVGNQAAPFLDWWSDRLSRDCIIDHDRGFFVDQRFVDFVPGLFDHHIVRDPGWNVAYWNLSTRQIHEQHGALTVDGSPLRFMHFSGYSPHTPDALSKHQGADPRVTLEPGSVLRRLCDRYGQQLLEQGYDHAGRCVWAYDQLPGGIRVDRHMRRVFRTALIASENGHGPTPPDPFDARNPQVFVEWLREPVDTGIVQISRYLREIWDSRRDLQTQYPHLRRMDGRRYLNWIMQFGRLEYQIPDQLLPRTPEPAKLPLPVVVSGYLHAELGIGEAARSIVEAVDRAGNPFGTIVYRETSSRQDARPRVRGVLDRETPTNIVCVNADMLPTFARDAGPKFFAGKHNIGIWFWETTVFPDAMCDAFDHIDEVWVASDFVAEVLRKHTDKPVLVMPLPVHVPKAVATSRRDTGLPDGFLFLFVFDFLSISERKNPFGLVEAFQQAFTPGSGPALVIKSINGDKKPRELHRLHEIVGTRNDIIVIDQYLSQHSKHALMATADCYVSLHRSEGFGLTMAESMALGKPVIATGYSGNMAFMDRQNSFLVDYALIDVPAGCEPYPEGAKWADPDLNHAAYLMRTVYEDPAAAQAVAVRGQTDLASRMSIDATAQFIQRRLEVIDTATSSNAGSRQRWRGARRRLRTASSRPLSEVQAQIDEAHATRRVGVAPRDPRPLQRAAYFVEHGPFISWQFGSGASRALRLLLRRVLRPYTVRQQGFEQAVVQSLQEQERAIAALTSQTLADITRLEASLDALNTQNSPS